MTAVSERQQMSLSAGTAEDNKKAVDFYPSNQSRLYSINSAKVLGL